MLEHLKAIGVGFYALCIGGLIIGSIAALATVLALWCPAAFGVFVALAVCWAVGIVLRSEGGTK